MDSDGVLIKDRGNWAPILTYESKFLVGDKKGQYF
jgi:hypothetical protein